MGRRYAFFSQNSQGAAAFNAAMNAKLKPTDGEALPVDISEETQARESAEGLDLADRHDPGARMERKALYQQQ